MAKSRGRREDPVERYVPDDDDASAASDPPPTLASSSDEPPAVGFLDKDDEIIHHRRQRVCGMFCEYSESFQQKRRWLYTVFELPEATNLGYSVACFILGLICTSILCLVIETEEAITRHLPENLFPAVEAVSTVIFTIELLLRLAVCDVRGRSTWQFVVHPANILDALAIMPWYIEQIAAAVIGPGAGSSVEFMRVLRIFRLARVTRLSRNIRNSPGLQIMGTGFARSGKPLSLLFFILMLGVVFFSSLMYYTEEGKCIRASSQSQCGVGVDVKSLHAQKYFRPQDDAYLCRTGLPKLLELNSSFAEQLGLTQQLVDRLRAGRLRSSDLTPELCLRARELACSYGDAFPPGAGDEPYFAACSLGVGVIAYPSIASSFWWSLVTMCTVGYGDIYPTTDAGKVIALFTMLTGVLLIALPMAIVGTEFLEASSALEAYLVEQKRKSIQRRTVSAYKRASASAFEALGMQPGGGTLRLPESEEGRSSRSAKEAEITMVSAFEEPEARARGVDMADSVTRLEDFDASVDPIPLPPTGYHELSRKSPAPPSDRPPLSPAAAKKAWGSLAETSPGLKARIRDVEKKLNRVETLNKQGVAVIRAYVSIAKDFGTLLRTEYGFTDAGADPGGNVGLGSMLAK